MGSFEIGSVAMRSARGCWRFRVVAALVAQVGSLLGVSAVAAQTPAEMQVEVPYSDVAGHWALEHVASLEALGVFVGTGCGEGLFCPGEALKRETMAVWMVRVVDGTDPEPVDRTRFADVDGSHRWAAFIERFAELGVSYGYGDGTYGPDTRVSRAQMAAFLSRAFDLPAADPAGFGDIEGNTHEADINRIAAAGITAGCGDGTNYCPNRPTSRAEMAVFIRRAIDWQAPELSLGEQLAALVLDRTNASRNPSWGALTLDAGLSAVAQTKAQAMADTQTWQYNFDFVSRLEPDWDIWRRGLSVRTDVDANDPRMAEEMGAALVDEDGAALLVCPLCTGLGTGLASANGRVYATVIVAGRIPGESISEHEMVDVEAEMADLVNDLRESLGLRPLEYHAGVAASARRWSQTMGAEQDFRHNLTLGDHYPPGFFMAGENIAAVKYHDSLSEAVLLAFGDFTNSPLHHANMTEPGFTHQGIGVVLKAGWVWITQNFAAYP